MPGAGKKRAAAQKKAQSGQTGAAKKSEPASDNAPGPSAPSTERSAIPSFDGAGDPKTQQLSTQPSDSPLFSGGRALELGASAWTYLDSVSVAYSIMRYCLDAKVESFISRFSRLCVVVAVEDYDLLFKFCTNLSHSNPVSDVSSNMSFLILVIKNRV